MKPVHSEVCGFFRGRGTQFLERDVAALMVVFGWMFFNAVSGHKK